MRVGIMTGGGDCPGLNAVIRAVVRKSEYVFGHELLGFINGWDGVISGEHVVVDVERMRGTLPRGGTVLGSSRTVPEFYSSGMDKATETLERLDVSALIVIGGDGTLHAAHALSERGVGVVGVPKTIDNDIPGTEYTFGFNTAVQVAADAIDRLHSTAESHNRVMVVEVMGRHTGHVAVHAGLASGATLILTPEHPFDIDDICDRLMRRHEMNRYASIIVVAEGAYPADDTSFELPDQGKDMWGHRRIGGLAHLVGAAIEDRTGFEARVTVLGHVQRGGKPTAFDRVLSTRLGIAAIDAVQEGSFGQMVALYNDEIVLVDLADVVGRVRECPPSLYHGVASWFFAR